MMNCQQMTEAIASDRLVDAGWRQRLSAWFHLAICKHCRCYQQQMATLKTAARDLFGKTPAPREDLEEAILDRCLKGFGDSKPPDEPRH